jgi:hypothetical protein
MNVIKIKTTTVDKLLAQAADCGFDELVLVGFKNDSYQIGSAGGPSKTKTIGVLEIIKHDLLSRD